MHLTLFNLRICMTISTLQKKYRGKQTLTCFQSASKAVNLNLEASKSANASQPELASTFPRIKLAEEVCSILMAQIWMGNFSQNNGKHKNSIFKPFPTHNSGYQQRVSYPHICLLYYFLLHLHIGKVWSYLNWTFNTVGNFVLEITGLQ